jgi:hypothetical protein
VFVRARGARLATRLRVSNRLAPILIATAVLGAAATLAALGIGRADPPSASPREVPAEPSRMTAEGVPPPDELASGGASSTASEMTLPPNHPAIGGASPHGTMAAASDESAALSWKMPADWEQIPSPSALRLATYRVPGGCEMSVSRAGGTTEANIQRWLSQFENAGPDTRAERTIRGLRVTLVQVAGTYEASPMMTPGIAPEARPDWALLGAIVETSGSPYFFKLLGPVRAIKMARASFERLLESLAPRGGAL